MSDSKDHEAVLPKLILQRLDPNATVPTKASSLSAGYDLYACSSGAITAGKHALVKTGWAMRMLEPGYYARIAPRSGLAWKNKIGVGAWLTCVSTQAKSA